jgi:hypothetical protein
MMMVKKLERTDNSRRPSRRVWVFVYIRRTLSKEFPMLVFDVERKQKKGKNNNDEDA